MFSSMVTAARGVKKGVLEDSYLYVGGDTILEVSTPKFGNGSTVDVVLPITTLSKVRGVGGEGWEGEREMVFFSCYYGGDF